MVPPHTEPPPAQLRRRLLKGLAVTSAAGAFTQVAQADPISSGPPTPQIAVSRDTLRSLDGAKGDLALTLGFSTACPEGGGAYQLVNRTPGARLNLWQSESASPDRVWQLIEPRPHAAMFGAIGDGVQDDTAALQAGLNYLSTVYGGGELMLNPQHYRVTGLQMPKMTGLVGSSATVATHYPTNLENSPFSLLLEGKSATVVMKEGSFLRGAVLRPLGMSFPQTADQIAQWSGTAVEIAPESGGIYIGYCTIVGFAQAVLADGTGAIFRPRLEQLSIDCLNGIALSFVPDIAYLSNIHCWNFGSTGMGAGNATARPGTAFRLSKQADWAKITNCFAYGYDCGFDLDGVADCTLTGCGADHDPRRPDRGSTTGFRIRGNSRYNRLINCQAAAMAVGISLEAQPKNPNAVNQVSEGSLWDNGIGIDIKSGEVSVANVAFRVQGGVHIADAAHGGRIANLIFERGSGISIMVSASARQHFLIDNDNL